jgi:hypothetical protein
MRVGGGAAGGGAVGGGACGELPLVGLLAVAVLAVEVLAAGMVDRSWAMRRTASVMRSRGAAAAGMSRHAPRQTRTQSDTHPVRHAPRQTRAAWAVRHEQHGRSGSGGLAWYLCGGYMHMCGAYRCGRGVVARTRMRCDQGVVELGHVGSIDS